MWRAWADRGCSSGGSTSTVADLMMSTLKQFASVDHVKIYDARRSTEVRGEHTDSIPTCLQP